MGLLRRRTIRIERLYSSGRQRLPLQSSGGTDPIPFVALIKPPVPGPGHIVETAAPGEESATQIPNLTAVRSKPALMSFGPTAHPTNGCRELELRSIAINGHAVGDIAYTVDFDLARSGRQSKDSVNGNAAVRYPSHKALTSSAAAVFVILLAGMLLTGWQAARARRAEQTAHAVSDFL